LQVEDLQIAMLQVEALQVEDSWRISFARSADWTRKETIVPHKTSEAAI
jgi:hypothetical protein